MKFKLPHKIKLPTKTQLISLYSHVKALIVEHAESFKNDKVAVDNSDKVFKDYSELLQQNFLSEYLTYRDYKDGTYINDGSYGFCMHATPLTGGSETIANQLMQIMKMRWPVNSTLSFMLYSSKELKPRLDAWKDRRANCTNPVIKKMAEIRTAYLSKGINKTLINNEKILVRDYKLVISVTIDGKPDKESLIEFENFKTSFENNLSNIGFCPEYIKPKGLINIIDELLNREEGFKERERRYNQHIDLNKQMIHPDLSVIVDKDGLAFNDTVVRGVAIKEYPIQESFARTMDLIGDILNNNAQITGQFLYVTNIWFPDISSLKTKVNAKSARAKQNADSPMAKWVPDFAKKNRDWEEALKILSDGQGMCYLNQSLFVFAEAGDSNHAVSDLMDVFSSKGWDVQPVSFIQLPVFLSALPMQFDNTCYQHIRKLGLTRLLPQWNIVNLILATGEWPGNSYDNGMIFVGRRGQLAIQDIFESEGNYNVAIAADSGAGKSFFMNDLIVSYLGLGAKIFIIDVGRSYLKLCEVFGGQFITFGSDVKNVCLNPFSYVDSGDNEDTVDNLMMIKVLIEQAVSPKGEVSNLESKYIYQAVQAVYYQKGVDGCFNDVYEYFIHHDEKLVRDLGVQFYDYSINGAYSRYFNGKANVEFNNQFIILELEELNQKKDLRPVILTLLMIRISQEMYLSPKSQYKICGIDEGWDLMRGGSSTQEFIETGYRRARKYHGSFITITQRIQDFYANAGAEACLTNSDSVFTLKQKPESVDQLKNDSKLALTDYGLELVKSIHTKKGKYSEIYVKTSTSQAPVRLMVDPYTSLVYTTDPKDFQRIDDYKAMGYKIEDAIYKVMEEKGLS